ncbi:MAG: ferredoxin family protein [Desulfobacterales bacterium]|nr:ferredoxin family protein [Desulfobacterales bacterium]
MAFKTNVDSRKCNGCEECLEVCSAGVLEVRNGKAIAVYPDSCVGCQSCVDVCKENAITMEDTRVQLSGTCLNLLKDIL